MPRQIAKRLEGSALARPVGVNAASRPELLDAAGAGTTVMVVSDHGFGATGRLPWSGGHGRLTRGAPIAPPGVLILSGPGIAGGGVELSRAQVVDMFASGPPERSGPADDDSSRSLLWLVVGLGVAASAGAVLWHTRRTRPREAVRSEADARGL